MTADFAFTNSIRARVKTELQNSGQYSPSLWDYLVDLAEGSLKPEIFFWKEILSAMAMRSNRKHSVPTNTDDQDDGHP